MMGHALANGTFRVALGAFALSVGALSRSLWQAARPEVAEVAESAPMRTVSVGTGPRVTNDELLQETVDVDPFHPARRRPSVRYGEPVVAAQPIVTPNVTRQVPRLIGTVVLADGASFAICQLDPQPPRVMRVGERLGDFVLERVTKGSVLFVTPDSSRASRARGGSPATRRDSVLLRVPKAGAP